MTPAKTPGEFGVFKGKTPLKTPNSRLSRCAKSRRKCSKRAHFIRSLFPHFHSPLHPTCSTTSPPAGFVRLLRCCVSAACNAQCNERSSFVVGEQVHLLLTRCALHLFGIRPGSGRIPAASCLHTSLHRTPPEQRCCGCLILRQPHTSPF